MEAGCLYNHNVPHYPFCSILFESLSGILDRGFNEAAVVVIQPKAVE